MKKKAINVLNKFAWKNTKNLNKIKYHNLNILIKYNTFQVDTQHSNKKWKKRKNFQRIVPVKLKIKRRKKLKLKLKFKIQIF